MSVEKDTKEQLHVTKEEEETQTKPIECDKTMTPQPDPPEVPSKPIETKDKTDKSQNEQEQVKQEAKQQPVSQQQEQQEQQDQNNGSSGCVVDVDEKEHELVRQYLIKKNQLEDAEYIKDKGIVKKTFYTPSQEALREYYFAKQANMMCPEHVPRPLAFFPKRLVIKDGKLEANDVIYFEKFEGKDGYQVCFDPNNSKFFFSVASQGLQIMSTLLSNGLLHNDWTLGNLMFNNFDEKKRLTDDSHLSLVDFAFSYYGFTSPVNMNRLTGSSCAPERVHPEISVSPILPLYCLKNPSLALKYVTEQDHDEEEGEKMDTEMYSRSEIKEMVERALIDAPEKTDLWSFAMTLLRLVFGTSFLSRKRELIKDCDTLGKDAVDGRHNILTCYDWCFPIQTGDKDVTEQKAGDRNMISSFLALLLPLLPHARVNLEQALTFPMVRAFLDKETTPSMPIPNQMFAAFRKRMSYHHIPFVFVALEDVNRKKSKHFNEIRAKFIQCVLLNRLIRIPEANDIEDTRSLKWPKQIMHYKPPTLNDEPLRWCTFLAAHNLLSLLIISGYSGFMNCSSYERLFSVLISMCNKILFTRPPVLPHFISPELPTSEKTSHKWARNLEELRLCWEMEAQIIDLLDSAVLWQPMQIHQIGALEYVQPQMLQQVYPYLMDWSKYQEIARPL